MIVFCRLPECPFFRPVLPQFHFFAPREAFVGSGFQPAEGFWPDCPAVCYPAKHGLSLAVPLAPCGTGWPKGNPRRIANPPADASAAAHSKRRRLGFRLHCLCGPYRTDVAYRASTAQSGERFLQGFFSAAPH